MDLTDWAAIGSNSATMESYLEGLHPTDTASTGELVSTGERASSTGANFPLSADRTGFRPFGPRRVTGKVRRGDFKISTPGAEVVDLGTEFGVAVDRQASTEICVFSGEVDVRSALLSSTQQSLAS